MSTNATPPHEAPVFMMDTQDTGLLPTDEMTRIRALLRPPPIPGVDDWGIPPEPTGACDPEIEVRPASILSLKHGSHQGGACGAHRRSSRSSTR